MADMGYIAYPKGLVEGSVWRATVKRFRTPWLWVSIEGSAPLCMHKSELPPTESPESAVGRDVEVRVLKVDEIRRNVAVSFIQFLT